MIRQLGYVISGDGVEMDASKVPIIVAWPETKTVKQLARFIRAANFYSQFVKNLVCQNVFIYLETSRCPE